MHEKDNYLKTAELSTEQNCNMIKIGRAHV